MSADSIDRFVEQLSESGLLSAEEIRAVRERRPAPGVPKDARELALELVGQKKLTAYQAEAVARGDARGLVLGNYVILDVIGRGGMGEVFRAEHRLMERVVALKILPPAFTRDETSVKRFLREVKAAAKLIHPNIVPAYDADRANDAYFLVMEYVAADNLSSVVKKRGPLPIGEAIDAVLQAARGLEYAHSRGVIHRDIKPSNLLRDGDGCVKILDMGLARIAGAAGEEVRVQGELTQSNVSMGTVDFMPPEQALSSKHADHRADIYSLGCTFHYLLTGAPPYDGGTSMARLLAHRERPIPSLRAARSDLPKAVDAVFRRMVAKRPEDRHATMAEVIKALEPHAESGRKKRERRLPVRARGEYSNDDPRLLTTMTEDPTLLQDEPSDRPREGNGWHSPPAPPSRRGLRRVLAAMVLLALGAVGVVAGSGYRWKVTPTNPRPKRVPEVKTAGAFAVAVPVVRERPRVEETAARPATPVPVPVPVPVTVAPRHPVAAPPVAAAPTPPAPVTIEPEREAAEWALKLGGTVGIVEGDRQRAVADVGDLPRGGFRVSSIKLRDNPRVEDAALERLGRLKSLEVLELDGTRVSDLGLGVLEGMTRLRDLRIARTRVTDAGMPHLRGLVNLVFLDIGQLEVSDAGLEALKGLPKLLGLDLKGTKVTDLGLAQLDALPGLQTLSLEGTRVGDAGLAHLAGMAELQDLSLDSTEVTDAGLAHLSRLASLLELSLREVPVGDAGLERLKGLTGLYRLALDGTRVSDAGLASLSGMTNLGALSLDHTDVGDAGLAHLKGLANLADLSLRATRVTEEGAAALKASLPECKINRSPAPRPETR